MMFDPLTARFLQSAPPIEGLDPASLPARLTQQYAELVSRRLRGASAESAAEPEPNAWSLARIADTYEIVTSLRHDADTRRASAFVAATAHQIMAREAVAIEPQRGQAAFDRDQVDPTISAALLFLAAEQYADAHEAARAIEPSAGEPAYVTAILAEHIRDLTRGSLQPILERAGRWRRDGIIRGNLADRAVTALYEALATGVEILAARTLSANLPGSLYARFDSSRAAFTKVLEISTRMLAIDAMSADGSPLKMSDTLLTTYAGPRHLASLLLAVDEGIADAALSRVPPPTGSDATFWKRWLTHRATNAPFVWPNHREALQLGFHETGNSAVMVLPTGAGKTTVAGIKVAGVLARGKKVVFLAPTHALVDQLTEDLQAMFPKDLLGSVVSSNFDLLFAAGAQLEQIEVMTPERCLAMLSFSPDVFAEVGLLVFDECHLLSPDSGNLRRALDGMFCVLAFNSLAPNADFLFLSAMLRNGLEFSKWVNQLTSRRCVFVDTLWKPSRQARGVVLYERNALQKIRESAIAAQNAEDARAGKKARTLRAKARQQLALPAYALFGLQHNWRAGAKVISIIAKISDEPVPLEGELDSSGEVSLKPNVNKVAARLAAASARNGLKAIVFVNAKSHAISTARDVAAALGTTPEPTTDEKTRWRALEIELGGLEHSMLPQGAAAVPHNAGMLRLERDLAERMFRRPDGAQVIVATPTLAQGLNLPAHIAILAGDKRADPDGGGRESLEAHEILNAAARAGRAGHLANGAVLLIPEGTLDFTGKSLGSGVSERLKSILPEDDRCVDVYDPLQVILDRISTQPALDSDVEYALNRLSTALSPEGIEAGAAARFDIKRSLAAFMATESNALTAFEAHVAALQKILGTRSEAANDEALSKLAAQSGAPIPVLQRLRSRLEAADGGPLPATIVGWIEWVIDWLSHDGEARAALLERERPTILSVANLNGEGALTSAAIQRLAPGIIAWIEGRPLRAIEVALGGDPTQTKHRMCPHARSLVTNILPLGFSFIMGLVARTIGETCSERKAIVPQAVIDCMATAVRRGYDTPEKVAYAEIRKGILSRVEVHLTFATEVPVPIDVAVSDDLGTVSAKLRKNLSAN